MSCPACREAPSIHGDSLQPGTHSPGIAWRGAASASGLHPSPRFSWREPSARRVSPSIPWYRRRIFRQSAPERFSILIVVSPAWNPQRNVPVKWMGQELLVTLAHAVAALSRSFKADQKERFSCVCGRRRAEARGASEDGAKPTLRERERYFPGRKPRFGRLDRSGRSGAFSRISRRTSRIARSSCGSLPAAQSCGSMSTSMSGSVP